MDPRLMIPRSSGWNPVQPLSGSLVDVWLRPDQSQCNTGGARQFTAANTEYLTAADSAALRTGDIDFTVAAWVYLDSAGADRYAVSKWGGATDEFALWLDDSESQFAFDVAGTSLVGATVTPTTGQWYLLIGEHDATANMLSLWVNSASADTTAHAGGATTGNSPLEIGAQSGAGPFDGRVARVGFWKRKLTAAERIFLWNSGQGRSGGDLGQAGTDGADLADADCVDYWDLNEASGDATGGINGTVLTDTNTVTAAAGITTRARQYTAVNSEDHRLPYGIADHSLEDADVFIGVWVYADAVGSNRRIYSRQAAPSSQLVIRADESSKLQVLAWDANAVMQNETSTSTISAWQWYFVLLCLDSAADQLRWWVNDLEQTPITMVDGFDSANGSASTFIGTYAGIAEFWDGRIGRTVFGKPPTAIADLIDDIHARFYGDGDGCDSTALTADEIANWGVVSMWDGDEVSGNLLDSVGAHDMTDTNTVTGNPGPGTELGVVVDGDPVQQFKSKEGSNRAFAQPTVAKKPTWNEADANFNNRPSLSFDGTDDLLRFAGTILTGVKGAVFAVVKRGATGAEHDIFSASDEAADNDYLRLGIDAANDDHQYEHKNDGGTETLSSGTSAGASDAEIWVWTSDGSTIVFRRNGVVDALTEDAGTNDGDWFGDLDAVIDNTVLGALKRSSETNQFNGELAELLVFDGVELAANDIARVERYLNLRYAVYP